MPNRFPDGSAAPDYNSIDAALWYAVAAGAYRDATADAPGAQAARDRARLGEAIQAVLEGYRRGTRYAIALDDDGLIAGGEPGLQLTWMDAKVGDWVVTPRIGKPIEVQALWAAALAAGGPDWAGLRQRAVAAIGRRFWNADTGCLYDVVDADHRAGRVDPAIRPNQILAVGGLGPPLLPADRARAVVDVVEDRLWTPLGLRSLDPADPAYRGRYAGGVRERDGAYHQGTVWPWLTAPFVAAWLAVRGDTPEAPRPDLRAEARRRFVDPLTAHLDTAGLDHVSEIADGDPPHHPRGCPFQAWSLAALITARHRTA